MPEQRPSEAAPWSGVSYYKPTKRVRAYSYERHYYRSYLRKRRGYKRRIRVWVLDHVKTVHVPERVIYVWTIEFPPPEREPKWLNVKDYEYQLETMISYHGGELTEYEMPIYHTDLEADSIYLGNLFVWPNRKFPHRVLRMEKQYGKAGKTPFTRVRVWFTVKKDDEDEFQVWCRTAMITATDYKHLGVYARDLYNQAVADQEEYNDMVRRHDPRIKSNTTPEGFTVQELVAWTGYVGDQKAPTSISTRGSGTA